MLHRTLRLVLTGALAAACSSQPSVPSDAGSDASDAQAPPEWRPVVEKLDGSLLSIWGTAADDVYAVGGPLGNAGFQTLALHFDGTKWKRLSPGHADSYWWVHGSGKSDVWMVGEKGRITHYDGASFQDHSGATTATLFGVWAASPSDAWAVGGALETPGVPNDVVLHWDGASWKSEALPETLNATYFKVWGSSASDVYVVGSVANSGVVWHRTGGAWKREAQNVANDKILTIAGCAPDDVYAVGGRQILHTTGDGTWTRVDQVAIVSDVNGVACAPSGAPYGKVVVVGAGSLKLRRVDGAWVSDFGTKPYADLHGAWVDPTGALWGVGGSFIAKPRPNATRDGVIARYGGGVVPGVLE
jgi:hypothetical protein